MNYGAGPWAMLALLIAAVLALLVLLGRRGVGFALAILTALWLAAFGVTYSGWRDLDGWVDCHDACSGGQVVTGVMLIWGPIVAATIVIGVAIAALVRSRRTK